MAKQSRSGREDMLADAKPSSHRSTAKLEAKPVKGPVDYAALRQRIIARFPKTIAYLAK
ncbi:MAG TPA: hypothetical protein VD906_11560 [Caulobacteraceae bacterium]|nr:hypothetical protein [Caulobacteraceae bacterium]